VRGRKKGENATLLFSRRCPATDGEKGRKKGGKETGKRGEKEGIPILFFNTPKRH